MSVISVSFSDEPEPVKSAGPLPTAATLLREIKGVVESGDLSAGTRVGIRLATQDSMVVFDGEWSETGVIFGQEPQIMLCHNLDEREEEELLHSLQDKRVARGGAGPGRNRGAVRPDTGPQQDDTEELLRDIRDFFRWLVTTTAGRFTFAVIVLLFVALIVWVAGSYSHFPSRLVPV